MAWFSAVAGQKHISDKNNHNKYKIMKKLKTQSKAENQATVIGCLSFSAIFEDCAECGKVTPFVNTLKCFYCGCDSPFGSYHDFDIPDEEIENYIEKHTITFGLISEIEDVNVIGFLNNL